MAKLSRDEIIKRLYERISEFEKMDDGHYRRKNSPAEAAKRSLEYALELILREDW